MPAIRARLDAVKVDELDGPPLCDVAPLCDRLVLFYADYRVPHEVLAAHCERLAVTCWYFDGAEHAAAKKRGKGRRPPASVGVWKERYRKRRMGALKDNLWRLRMKLASAEQRHGQAEESCGEIQRGLHRVRGAVATEQQAKRQPR